MTLTIDQKNSIAERYKQSFGLDDILEVDDQRTGVETIYTSTCYGTRDEHLLRIRSNGCGDYAEEEIKNHPGRETAGFMAEISGCIAVMNGLFYAAGTAVDDAPGLFYPLFYATITASILGLSLGISLAIRNALYETRIWNRFQEKKENPHVRYYPCI